MTFIPELPQESIDGFKRIFKEEYGADYTDEEAREANNNLVNFFYLLMQIDQRNKGKNSEIARGVNYSDAK